MILAKDFDSRQKALSRLLPLQKKDFVGIFAEMKGCPVTIRLLDPPLHEFLPQETALQAAIAKELKISVSEVSQRTRALHETNPMMGHRGCRLGITYPEIYDMQVQAIIQAALECKKKKIAVKPEIMIPLVGTDKELQFLRDRAVQQIRAILSKAKQQLSYKIGTMIEVPRAALTAQKIAAHADFFSFGTNDLTQMTYGFSREDITAFLPEYVEQGILAQDPFQVLDQEGVGALVSYAIELARSVKKNISIGICGEHGGEPSSIAFGYHLGLNYVSCSPYRVPIARLAVAQEITRKKA